MSGNTYGSAIISTFGGNGNFSESAHELFKISPEVNNISLALTLVPAFIVVFGLFSGFIKERLYLGEAIVALGFGIALSGYGAGVFNPRSWSGGEVLETVTLELTRIVIALSVFAVGVELPKAYVLRHWRSLAVLLGPVMLIGWLMSGALIYGIIPGLDILPALIIAAGVSPTDPILAASVVGKGKYAMEHVPSHIRHILQAESGSNDGAAFPFLYLALFLFMREEQSVGATIGKWVTQVILYQIVLGAVIGAAVGIAARKALKFSKRRRLIDRESMIALYVSLSLTVTGATTLAGSDDLLAAFACGTAFAWDDWFTESIEESNFSSTIDLLSNCTVFIYLGATMPFSDWSDPVLTLVPWRLVVLAISILCLRRIPAIYLMKGIIPDIKTNREALFCGHFGPMGVGAIFISTLAAHRLPTPAYPPVTQADLLALTIQPITYFIVLSSVLVHGLTIGFFSLGRRVHSRVQSISRTFTQASGMGKDDEPSWMSRVRRVADPADIVINRDDDLEQGDLGKLRMFGAPSDSEKTREGSAETKDFDEKVGLESEEKVGLGEDGVTENSKNEVEEGREEEIKEKQEIHDLETDDDPKYNILTEAQNEHDSHPNLPSAASIKSNESVKSVSKYLPPDMVVPASIVKRATANMKRRGTLIRESVLKVEDGLTPEERELKRLNRLKEKELRDRTCKKEQHFRDRDEEPIASTSATNRYRNGREPAKAPRTEWIEGDEIITETKNGENVTVRQLTTEEKEFIKKQEVVGVRNELHKLKVAVVGNVGHSIISSSSTESDAEEKLLEGSHGRQKGKAVENDKSLQLTRTKRIDEDSDSDSVPEEWEDIATTTPVTTLPPSTTPARPQPRRGSSVLNSFFKRNKTPQSQPRSEATPSAPSIRFVTPPVGVTPTGSRPSSIRRSRGDLKMSRTNTSSSIRFLDEQK